MKRQETERNDRSDSFSGLTNDVRPNTGVYWIAAATCAVEWATEQMEQLRSADVEFPLWTWLTWAVAKNSVRRTQSRESVRYHRL